MRQQRDNCDSEVTITYEDAGSLDNCDGSAVATRTWTATDDCGNTSTAQQKVYRTPDTEAPVLTGVGPDGTYDCTEAPVFSNPGATDDCDSDVDITYEDVDNGAGCLGGITRIWTATDDCGNTSTASQTMTAVDDEAPVFTSVPADYTVDCNEVAIFGDATAT